MSLRDRACSAARLPGRACPGPVPEGRLRLAQRFNAGESVRYSPSPGGTADETARGPEFSRPSGTRAIAHALPSVETLGYSQMSLRDRACSAARLPGRACPGPVPEGHVRIAQRFNAGESVRCSLSPGGTADGTALAPEFSRPFGTWPFVALFPALKRWAILTCPSGTRPAREPVEFAKGMGPSASTL